MIFNSGVFLFLFLPVVYFVFWRLRTKDHRYAWLTVAGYVFYGYWDYRFCVLMLFSTLVSYGAGLALSVARTARQRKFWLILPITVDLTLLGIFKYAGFALESLQRLAKLLHLSVSVPLVHIILPIGISFYTFHTITYIVDAYRGVIKPTRNFFEFSCYVSLFSQLIAGPIVRFRQIEQDLENIDQVPRKSYLTLGWSFFALGMIEKVLIADVIASAIDPALKNYQQLSTWVAWLCAIGYSYQLYFDFSGYSSMAVGLGYLFGLRLPQNFNSPYKAVDMSDFWSRWHISLSTVLRDYLYIPLGGNRVAPWAVYRNLMITMLLGGLWHGANWTFVFWGAYHGTFLILYRAFPQYWDALPRALRMAGTFFTVLIGWVFFRSDSFEMALHILREMFHWTRGASLSGSLGFLSVLVIAAWWAHLGPNPFEMKHNWRSWKLVGLCTLFALTLLLTVGGQESPFLYFQF